MSRSRIEWCERTWNPILGCSVASPGCRFCYAASFAHRGLTETHKGLTVMGEHGPEFNGTVRLLPDRLGDPLRWRKPTTVFVCSMSDLFHPEVPDEFIHQVFATMAATPQHTYQVLTKRPQRLARLLAAVDTKHYVAAATHRLLGVNVDAYVHVDVKDPLQMVDARGLGRAIRETRAAAGLPEFQPWPLPNVWCGASVENDRYTWRADHLRDTPAAVRFLSVEPLIGPVPSLDFTGIDWVIVGGESGRGARRMDLEWVDDIITRAKAAGAAVFVKQLGSAYRQPGDSKAGKWESMPVELRLREMPR